MGSFISALKIHEIPSGSMKTVAVRGKPIAIANVDGTFFAVDDACSHARCSLGGEGFIDGNILTCGCHGAQFDVTNGKAVSLPAIVGLTSYNVKVQGDDVFVEV